MKNLFSLLFLLLLFSCGNDGPENSALLGKWKGITWKVDGKDSGRNAGKVVFEFLPSGTYSASFGSQTEKGNFKTKGNKLYTTAEGKVEKMVKVILSSPDTLLMDMNRVGTPEVLTLVRE